MDSRIAFRSAQGEVQIATEEVVDPVFGVVHLLRFAGGGGGISAESVSRAVRIDMVTDLLLYLGRANPGGDPSTPEWQIKRLTLTEAGSVVLEYADGDGDFDNAWDNRASLIYS